MAYQPTWIKGRVTAEGDRACAERYAPIADVLREYRRHVTVWDLGANQGYFGHRLTDEFGCVSIMADYRPQLAAVCRANAGERTIALTHTFTASDLWELANSEHVGVVLALNVLHHMPDWEKALPALCNFGENILIETPGRGDTGSANYAESQKLLDAIEALEPELVTTFKSHVTPGIRRPLYRLRRPKDRIKAGYAYIGRVRPRGPHKPRPHVITSTLTEKTITYQDGESRPWVHGMNLWNWLQMGGSYPSKATVKTAVCEAAARMESPHGDLRPWNVILQGTSVTVIDSGHRRSVDDAIGLRDLLAWIDMPELAYAH